MAATGYGYPWLHSLLERDAGLDFDEAQLGLVEELAERKVVDLFDVAEDTAAANGRGLVVIGRVVLVVEGPDGTGASARPSTAALGRVEAVLDLTL